MKVAEQANTVAENTKAASASPTDLQMTIIKEGQGEGAKPGDSVTVNYTGTFLDGTKFDSSIDRGQPFTFKLGAKEVIEGWDLGVNGMKVGEQRKLIIPGQFAYGEAGRPGIPPNTTLVFDITMMGINK